jgi:hypothetical protein
MFYFYLQQGERVMVAPWVKPEDFEKLFTGKGVDVAQVPSGKAYIRLTDQPK